MCPIESASAPSLARGSPHHVSPGFSARSGAARAEALQSPVTAPAAAPVETAQAVPQAQATRAASQAAAHHAADPLGKPMTALLLHELHLQQELADLQEKKAQDGK